MTITANLARMLADLCELDPPAISGQHVEQSNTEYETLIGLGALVHSGNGLSTMCIACDEPHALTVEFVAAGRYRAYCPDAGYHDVDPTTLRQFSVNVDWIVGRVAAGVGINRPVASLALPVSSFMRIGRARFGRYPCELFFGRRLSDRSHLDAAFKAVSSVTGTVPSIIVSSTPGDLIPGAVPPRRAIVSLADALRIEATGVTLDEEPFLAALRGTVARAHGDGLGFVFSPGFRSAIVEDNTYSFTDKQALVVEALHEAWRMGTGRLHQDEIKGQADTSQRVGQIFRGNPAYGTLINYDGQGYYWLDL